MTALSEYRLIPLSGNKGAGKSVKVSPEDYDWASQQRWHLSQRYASRRRNGRVEALHRLIAGAAPGQHVDHINRDPLDNRRENLRLCTPAENAWNMRAHQDAMSRYKGVTFAEGVWIAQVGHHRRSVYIGAFRTEEEAARAYDAVALHLFGEFAHPNFPDSKPRPLEAFKRLKHHRQSSSRYRGVYYNRARSKWAAQYGKRYLGLFVAEVDAAKAYNEAARADLGEAAILNPV